MKSTVLQRIKILSDQLSEELLQSVDEDFSPEFCNTCQASVVMLDQPVEFFLDTTCPICAVAQMGALFDQMLRLLSTRQVRKALALAEVASSISHEMSYEMPPQHLDTGYDAVDDVLRGGFDGPQGERTSGYQRLLTLETAAQPARKENTMSKIHVLDLPTTQNYIGSLDRKSVEEHYEILVKFAPTIANIPIVVGSWIKSAIESGAVDLNTIRTLLFVQNEYQRTFPNRE